MRQSLATLFDRSQAALVRFDFIIAQYFMSLYSTHLGSQIARWEDGRKRSSHSQSCQGLQAVGLLAAELEKTKCGLFTKADGVKAQGHFAHYVVCVAQSHSCSVAA